MPNTTERVLVTGGAGFIGSHLCDRLLTNGAAVHCLDNFDPFYDPALKRRYIADLLSSADFTLTEGDILDDGALDRAFDWKPTVVVHLAALAGVRPSIQAPARYMKVNVEGTTNLLQRSVEARLARFVFASSSSVYGNRPTVPFAESDRVDDPASPYAASKKAGELVCHTFHDLYGIDVTCLRFFTVYGPRQRPEMAIHKFVRAILAGDEVTLFGEGDSSRDYTYIDDIIDGLVAAIERPFPFEIINLGGSNPVSLDALVSLIEEITGAPAHRKLLPAQPGDVERTYASVEKAERLLDYHPRVALDEGIRRFVDWFRAFQPGP